MDTLDNVGAHTQTAGETGDFFSAVSEENKARIRRQNEQRISVIIGNPPYNANQMNENDNNKNRKYDAVDTRISKTYIAASTAQKTKLYDMYARFFRWASDRLTDDGIIALITNRSFIDSRTFDGFRQCVSNDFHEAWIIDLGGDWKKSGDTRASGGNVFSIGTGVAISFWIKKRSQQTKQSFGRIYYIAANQVVQSAADKLTWLDSHQLRDMAVEELIPDVRNQWLDLTDNDFDTLIPLANKTTKLAKKAADERAIFKLYSLGVVTARDEWVYDFHKSRLFNKIQYLTNTYNALLSDPQDESFPTSIKWTRALKTTYMRKEKLETDDAKIRLGFYHPFVKKYIYFDKSLNEFQYQTSQFWPTNHDKTLAICFTIGGRLEFSCLITNAVPNLTIFSLDANQVLGQYRYDTDGNEFENITDWALAQFTTHYQTALNSPARALDKPAIFHYCYAVLHDPIYRDKYALNLKRDFPRIPFYSEFWRWVDWGAALLDLHLNYEQIAPFPFTRIDQPDERARSAGVNPKVLLRADVNTGSIRIDSETTLNGIPAIAWTYQLGNRCAIEWILDQYKEKTSKDPTIRARFNTYRFADYKETVIDLIARVTTVSIETMQIVNAMRELTRPTD
ncbi:Eco57I restriction-modification methylase domain-containing protein [Rhodoferax sp. 4810]|uniref:site-specific DNA-methyltransferase (adenine-specific) n=1 Tax=Thiospirillum jenense TaxID=1653858 RepID=A0A839HCI8_9GAMM|nr:Eco57I restriction-modification methylase domain-containing protein [Rhodoferax jenense]MBB1124759.1 Eco57I restriction-modification methylase domain-containing protein [Thiospirillum jenense]